MKLTMAIDDFLIAIEADGLKKNTIARYRSLLKHLIEWIGDPLLADVQTDDLRKYIIHLRGKHVPDTAYGHIRALHRLFSWCSVEYGNVNPLRNVKYPSQPVQNNPKSVVYSDVIKLFEACGDNAIGRRNRAILAMLYDTGCRAAGICTLLVENVNMDKKQAIVTEKNEKTRVVVFTGFTATILERWLQVRDPASETVFYNMMTLNPLTPNGLLQMTRRLKKEAGVVGRANPHAFRHGFARGYLKNGGDLATLSRLMGHAKVSTTASNYAVFSVDEMADLHANYSPMKDIEENLES